VQLDNIVVGAQFRRRLLVLRYNPDLSTVGTPHYVHKTPAQRQSSFILRGLKEVVSTAAHAESFPSFLMVMMVELFAGFLLTPQLQQWLSFFVSLERGRREVCACESKREGETDSDR